MWLMLLRPDGLQGPLIGSACCPAEDIKIAVVNKDLEELAIEALPMIQYFLHYVVALAEIETNRPFFAFSTCEAFNLDVHTGLLGLGS
jgi:hypothetical protein